jgi:hypothetical protein
MSARLEELRARFAAHKQALERWSEWTPHRPHPKQREFMELTELEALYGGAAGSGKTDALLADALAYVHEPRYSALLLRRTFPDLALPGALMDRSHAWLDGTRATWNERDKQWTFPTGATLQFGYCNTKQDLQRYKSAEFQYLGVDELTEWPEAWYTFLFSRLRRIRGSAIPIRARSATNPDGPGYGWVRRRFDIPENTKIERPIRATPNRVFLPARAEHNPSVDLEAYELALEQMLGGRKGTKWKQLRDGIWVPDGAGLVYVYDEKLNSCALPNWQREKSRWHFILGIDYGFSSACGFSVIAWRDNDPNVYVFESFTVERLDATAAAGVVRGLDEMYAFEKMVGDVGGLGKVYAEEGRARFTLPIEPAKKENKRGYQMLFGDALANGRIKVVVATSKDLLDEWELLPWDEERKKELDGFANHAADATLYAWRECPNYHERAPADRPTPGSPEALAEEERRLEEAVDEELEAEEQRDRAERRRGLRRR